MPRLGVAASAPNGCEVCGGHVVIVLRRALPTSVPGQTGFDPQAPKHRRCALHLGDAWKLDGLDRGQTFHEKDLLYKYKGGARG